MDLRSKTREGKIEHVLGLHVYGPSPMLEMATQAPKRIFQFGSCTMPGRNSNAGGRIALPPITLAMRS